MITERLEFSNENFGTLHHKLDNLPRIVFDLLRKLEQQPEHNQPAPLFRMVAVELRQEIAKLSLGRPELQVFGDRLRYRIGHPALGTIKTSPAGAGIIQYRLQASASPRRLSNRSPRR